MKSQIARIIQNLAFLNLVLATSTASAAAISLIILDLPIRYEPLLIIFLVTFAGYTLNRYTDKEDYISHPKRTQYMLKWRNYLIFSALIAYGTAIFISWETDIYAFFITILPGVAICLYSVQWIPKSLQRQIGCRRIKELHLIKNLFVAAVWSFTVIFLPLSYYNFQAPAPAILIWVFFFGRFLINTIVFDLKDIEGDREFNIKSIPVRFGWNKALKIAGTLNLFFFVLISSVTITGYLPVTMNIVNIIATSYSFVYIYFAGKNKSNIHLLCDVFVDGEYIVIAIILLTYLTVVA